MTAHSPHAPAPPAGVLAYEAPAPSACQGVFLVTLRAGDAEIRTRLHLTAGDAAILWVFGAGGGLGGPAGGVYDRLGEALRPEGLTSLELDYREPARLAPCVEDVLAGVDYLKRLGKRRIVLVGHSFGGAVVIAAAAESPDVTAVAALSSQTSGTQGVGLIAPRPMLFVHGEADEILPVRCSLDLYARAGEPKQMILYPGCRHGLDQCREALDRDLAAWLRAVCAGGALPQGLGDGG